MRLSLNRNKKTHDIYYLSHEVEGEDYDEVTRIAVYSTREKGRKGLAKFQCHPKFIHHPEGFYLERYLINHKEWAEGFSTWEPEGE